ncbi:MAG: hypothetical protein ACERKZ_15015 [Lachnotalea sp.]
MIKLDKKKLNTIISKIEDANMNTMFAIAVLEGKVEGIVYADDKHNPTSCYIQHPCGMDLLYGETDQEKFYEECNWLHCSKRR